MTNAFPSNPITGLKRRTKSPGEVEFTSLFQLLPGPALLVDAARGQVTLANSPFLKLTAYALNEIQGRELHTLVSGLPSHLLSSDETLGVLLERRNRQALPVNVQVRALDPAGQWLSLIFDQKEDRRKNINHWMDEIVQALGQINQLPDDEPYRKTLERSLGIIQELLNLTTVALYRVDNNNGQIWKIAQAGEPGLLPEAIPQGDWLRFTQTFVWQPGRRVQTELHRAARINNLTYVASTPTVLNGLLVLADRAQEPPEYLNIVLEAVGKQIGGMLLHLKQVMDLKKQALEHRRELSVWRSMGENAQEGILLLSPDFSVYDQNPAAEWMLGYTDWEVRGQPVENILIGPERLLPALETALEGIPTHNMGNVSLHRRNGQPFPAHIQIIPVQREGETLAILISFNDISENLEIRNRTQQLEQRAVLGDVTSAFAHEVRNPINNIFTGLQLLNAKLPENDPNQENVARMITDCQRIDHLMESVLIFARQAEHKFEDFDIEVLLHRMLDRWRPRFAKKNVETHLHKDPNTPNVFGDPRSLEQVFTNLFSNALEAMGDKGGTLAVQIEPFQAPGERPKVKISVTDSGPGIPDEIREHIFEPFLSTKEHGTGLGLAITKRIVTAHHGKIEVNSFPGGTVFTVLLMPVTGEKE